MNRTGLATTEVSITGAQITAGMTLVARYDVEMYVSSVVYPPSGLVSFTYTTDLGLHAEVFHGQLQSWETIRAVRRSA